MTLSDKDLMKLSQILSELLTEKDKGNNCIFNDDLVNETTRKMTEADGIILGSPVYYSGVNGTMKSFLDRAFFA